MVTINKQFAFGANEGSSQKTQSLYIILHEVGVDNSSAQANAAYFKNNWSTAETYSTFVVGADGIYQVGEPGYVAWAALNANPYAPVQIEFERTNDADRFKKGYANYIALAREMADKYGIPKTLDAGGAGTPGIKSHLWVTNNYGGDHVDPYGYLASHGISKSQLAKDLANGVGTVVTSNPAATAKPKPVSNIPAGFTAESGTFVNGDTPIMNRVGAPSTGAAQGGYLPAYGTWPYDSWAKVGNFTWIHHVYNGQHIYLPVRQWTGNSSTPWGTFK